MEASDYFQSKSEAPNYSKMVDLHQLQEGIAKLEEMARFRCIKVTQGTIAGTVVTRTEVLIQFLF